MQVTTRTGDITRGIIRCAAMPLKGFSRRKRWARLAQKAG